MRACVCVCVLCRCRKLPKGLKEWQAFNDLKRKIDEFNETCPLLELMANKSMKERHWERMAGLTGHAFDVTSESFLLRHIMEAPLLQHKDDIEDICIAAVKEKDIEAKLKQVDVALYLCVAQRVWVWLSMCVCGSACVGVAMYVCACVRVYAYVCAYVRM